MGNFIFSMPSGMDSACYIVLIIVNYVNYIRDLMKYFPVFNFYLTGIEGWERLSGERHFFD